MNKAKQKEINIKALETIVKAKPKQNPWRRKLSRSCNCKETEKEILFLTTFENLDEHKRMDCILIPNLHVPLQYSSGLD